MRSNLLLFFHCIFCLLLYDVLRILQIKADRTLTYDTLNAPWLLTDNSNGLVMVIRNYHWLNSASRVLISTCSAPLVQTGECKQFSCLTLTFDLNLRLAKVKVDPHTNNQGQRSNGSNRRVPTYKRTDTHRDTHTHGRYHPIVLSPLLRGNASNANAVYWQSTCYRDSLPFILNRRRGREIHEIKDM